MFGFVGLLPFIVKSSL